MLRYVCLITLGLALASTGYAAPRASEGSGGTTGVFAKQTLAVAGVERAYKLVAPKSLDPKKPAALVFAFHGFGDSKELMSFYSQLDGTAEKHGFVLVYLDARRRMWPLLPALAKDDLAFFDTVYDRVVSQYNVDLNRVHLVGMSNGAYFSHLVARERPDKVASIACHSGGLGAMDQDPKLERKYAVLLVHGEDDSIVKVSESRKARDAYAKWGHEVELVEVAGLNHFWAHKVKVNEQIWKFFANHVRPD